MNLLPGPKGLGSADDIARAAKSVENSAENVVASNLRREGRGIGSGAALSSAARGLSGTAIVSPTRVEAFLVKNGFTRPDAKSFVGSFEGPITARIVRSSEDFLRYTGSPTSTGSFLTKTRFADPTSAIEGLHLSPYGNPAAYVQKVTSSGRSIVFEGAIKNGGIGISQTVIHNRGAFKFGIGQGF